MKRKDDWQGVVIVVTGGNKNPLITTPYHSYYQVVRLCVVIVVIKKRELFRFFSNFGTFMYLSLRRPLSAKEKSMLFHP